MPFNARMGGVAAYSQMGPLAEMSAKSLGNGARGPTSGMPSGWSQRPSSGNLPPGFNGQMGQMQNPAMPGPGAPVPQAPPPGIPEGLDPSMFTQASPAQRAAYFGGGIGNSMTPPPQPGIGNSMNIGSQWLNKRGVNSAGRTGAFNPGFGFDGGNSVHSGGNPNPYGGGYGGGMGFGGFSPYGGGAFNPGFYGGMGFSPYGAGAFGGGYGGFNKGERSGNV